MTVPARTLDRPRQFRILPGALHVFAGQRRFPGQLLPPLHSSLVGVWSVIFCCHLTPIGSRWSDGPQRPGVRRHHQGRLEKAGVVVERCGGGLMAEKTRYRHDGGTRLGWPTTRRCHEDCAERCSGPRASTAGSKTSRRKLRFRRGVEFAGEKRDPVAKPARTVVLGRPTLYHTS
jgi:hypothetical protein